MNGISYHTISETIWYKLLSTIKFFAMANKISRVTCEELELLTELCDLSTLLRDFGTRVLRIVRVA